MNSENFCKDIQMMQSYAKKEIKIREHLCFLCSNLNMSETSQSDKSLKSNISIEKSNKILNKCSLRHQQFWEKNDNNSFQKLINRFSSSLLFRYSWREVLLYYNLFFYT